MKFKYNQRVISVNCFHSNFKGRVIDYFQGKTGNSYKVEGRFKKEDKLEVRQFEENELIRYYF